MCQPSSGEILANNLHQKTEALGEYNRYFTNKYYGRDATDDECMIYYIINGGAEGHRQRVEEHEASHNE
ncbi:MAG: hypothetical protein Q8P20_08450 [bacterium]|nr:hypothetical protein [bacterium]